MEKVNNILADLGMFLLVAFLALYTSGCSFHVGVDWNGETAKDNRTFTAKK